MHHQGPDRHPSGPCLIFIPRAYEPASGDVSCGLVRSQRFRNPGESSLHEIVTAIKVAAQTVLDTGGGAGAALEQERVALNVRQATARRRVADTALGNDNRDRGIGGIPTASGSRQLRQGIASIDGDGAVGVRCRRVERKDAAAGHGVGTLYPLAFHHPWL